MSICVCVFMFNVRGKPCGSSAFTSILPGLDDIVLTGGPATTKRKKKKSGIRKHYLYILAGVRHGMCELERPLVCTAINSSEQWSVTKKKVHMRCGLLEDDCN